MRSRRRGASRREPRGLSLPRRIGRFLRSIFASGPSGDAADDPRGFSGGVGVREPRRPIRPTSSGAVALEPPPTDRRDVWAVGEDDGS
jgi:hypothetical protein